jgi:hypothetical protein
MSVSVQLQGRGSSTVSGFWSFGIVAFMG